MRTSRSSTVSKAAAVPGVVRILTYKDVPGENQIGGIIPDEPLFAEQEIHFWGMPVALDHRDFGRCGDRTSPQADHDRIGGTAGDHRSTRSTRERRIDHPAAHLQVG
jgi:hypothetical protein